MVARPIPGCVLLLAAMVIAGSCGCTIGPPRLHSDFIGYNAALRDGFRTQLLLNLVRARYGESQDFLVVDGISTQYLLEHETGVSGTIIESAGNILGMSGATTFNERPTVTYLPTQKCATFNAQLRRPLPAEVLHYLIDDGYSKDQVLHLAIRQVNRLRNVDSLGEACPPDPASFAGFQAFVDNAKLLLDADQLELHYQEEWESRSPALHPSVIDGDSVVSAQEQGVEFRVDKDPRRVVLKEEVKTLTLRVHPEAALSPPMLAVAELLDLVPGRLAYEIEMDVEGHLALHAGPLPIESIHVTTRSFAGLMRYLAPAVEPPQEHLRQGIVDVPAGCGTPAVPFRVLSSKSRPKQALVAVPYRGYWFYIDDRDLPSRNVLRMVTDIALVQLSCENLPSSGPVLTLPVGG